MKPRVARSVAGKFRRFSFRGPRRGLAANRNNCIAAARSAYVLFLDDDARLSASFVEVALSAAGPDRLVTGWELRNDGKVTPTIRTFSASSGSHRAGPRRGSLSTRRCSPSLLQSRGFDDFYEIRSEEIDIAFGAAKRGLKIVEVDEGNVTFTWRAAVKETMTPRRLLGCTSAYVDIGTMRGALHISLSFSFWFSPTRSGSVSRGVSRLSLPSTASAFGRAAWRAWFMSDESLTVTPSVVR